MRAFLTPLISLFSASNRLAVYLLPAHASFNFSGIPDNVLQTPDAHQRCGGHIHSLKINAFWISISGLELNMFPSCGMLWKWVLPSFNTLLLLSPNSDFLVCFRGVSLFSWLPLSSLPAFIFSLIAVLSLLMFILASQASVLSYNCWSVQRLLCSVTSYRFPHSDGFSWNYSFYRFLII